MVDSKSYTLLSMILIGQQTSSIEITTGDQVVTELHGDPHLHSFTQGTQTVNVSAVDDLIYEGDHSDSITHH